MLYVACGTPLTLRGVSPLGWNVQYFNNSCSFGALRELVPLYPRAGREGHAWSPRWQVHRWRDCLGRWIHPYLQVRSSRLLWRKDQTSPSTLMRLLLYYGAAVHTAILTGYTSREAHNLLFFGCRSSYPRRLPVVSNCSDPVLNTTVPTKSGVFHLCWLTGLGLDSDSMRQKLCSHKLATFSESLISHRVPPSLESSWVRVTYDIDANGTSWMYVSIFVSNHL
jgi:hypothetical protein